MRASIWFPRALVWMCGIASALLLAVALLKYPYVGQDFELRHNEIQSVVSHTDPYLIWSGVVEDARFYPLAHPELKRAESQKQIHAYTPWGYTYLMPIAIFPIEKAWAAFQVLMWCAILVIGVLSFWMGFEARKSAADGITGVASAFGIGVTYAIAYIYGNYSIIIAALFFVMVICLNRKWDVLAGACWALAMVKPQCALLIGIPLLLQRKWKVMMIAVAIVGAASLIPAHLCGRSPVEMVLQIPKLGGAYYQGGTAIFPEAVVNLVCGYFPALDKRLLLPINAALGIMLCFWLCWMVRRASDWSVKIAPAIVMAIAWTYLSPYDRCILALPMVVVMAQAVKVGTSTAFWKVAWVSILLWAAGIYPIFVCNAFIQAIVESMGFVYSDVTFKFVLSWVDAIAAFSAVIVFIRLIVYSGLMKERPVGG